MKPFDSELADTFRAICGLPARRPDDLEDYYHNALIKAMIKGQREGRPLTNLLDYVYKSVSRRVACGQEPRDHLQLEESLVEQSHPIDNNMRIDLEAVFQELTSQQQTYIYQYYIEGFTLEEIAMLHDITAQAVDQTIKRGITAMQKRFKQ